MDREAYFKILRYRLQQGKTAMSPQD